MNTHKALQIRTIERAALVLLLVVVSLATAMSIAWLVVHLSERQAPIEAEPLDLVDTFHSAVNGDNAEAVLALFTEDATVTEGASVFRGREEIRNWVSNSQYLVGFKLTMMHSQVAGEKVFWQDLAVSGPEAAGRTCILRWIAVIQKGKIQSLMVSLPLMPDGK